MPSEIILTIRKELEKNADSATRESGIHFFKEEVHLYGVKSALVGKIAAQHFKSIKNLAKSEIFSLCAELFQSDMMEESFIACDWAYALRAQFEAADFSVFEGWVNTYIHNWAACDTLCNHTLGSFIEMYPQFLANLKGWTQSPNRWVRRASAVTLILPARKGLFLADVFAISDALLLDGDDLVQKGYGWALKEASRMHQAQVFNYILKHKALMPRTALRYAIEKMPPELRTRAIQK